MYNAMNGTAICRNQKYGQVGVIVGRWRLPDVVESRQPSSPDLDHPLARCMQCGNGVGDSTNNLTMVPQLVLGNLSFSRVIAGNMFVLALLH